MTTIGSAPRAESLSVAILIENEVLCRGLEAVLQSISMTGSVFRCGSRDQLAELMLAHSVDVLIISAAADWLDAESASLAGTGTKILALLDESVAGDLAAHATVPADGFLSQQGLSTDTLREALRRCQLGELPMPPALARALLARADLPPRRSRPVNLTAREAEALALLARGMSNKQIARRLSISSHGAKRLVACIMLKLDSPNRTAAVVNAIKAGLVECE
jgi:two-component system, NarL family, nitrate/nitrite response regulator NarL